MSKLLCNVSKISGGANAPNAPPGSALYQQAYPKRPKRGFGNMNMTSYCSVTNNSRPVTMTNIRQ